MGLPLSLDAAVIIVVKKRLVNTNFLNFVGSGIMAVAAQRQRCGGSTAVVASLGSLAEAQF